MKSKNLSTRKASVSAILARLLQRGLGVVSVAAPSAPSAPKPWNTSQRRSMIALETLEPRLLLSGSPGALDVNGVLTGNLTADADAVVVALSSLNGGVAADGGLIIDLTVSGEMQTYGTAAVGVQSILLNGLGGDDSFRVASALAKPITITGGDGIDTLFGTDQANLWIVSGANAGTLNGSTSFAGVENLTGRGDADAFTFGLLGSISAQLDGGNGADTLTGPNADTVWTLSAEGAGLLNDNRFVAIESVTGGSSDDAFTVQFTGPTRAVIAGGSGSDTLIGNNIKNTWSLPGLGTGTLNPDTVNPVPNDTVFTGIENLTGGSDDDKFVLTGATAGVFGAIVGGVSDPASPTTDVIDFSAKGAVVVVDLALANATGIGSFTGITTFIGDAGAGDELIGPAALADQTRWNITGANAGEVEGTAFAGFELLTGQAASSDAFVFGAGGSLQAGSAIRGGSGSLDGFAVDDGAGNLTAFQPVSADAAGTATVGDKTIQYTGMDAYNPLNAAGPNRVFTGSIFDRDITLTVGATTTTASFSQLAFTTGSSAYTFANPTGSLAVTTGSGDDRVTVTSVDPAFAGALLTYSGGALTAKLTNNADAATVGLAAPGASIDEGLTITVTVNGFAQSFGSVAQGVKSIALEGRGGADGLTFDAALPITVTVDGGGGTDTLTGPTLGTEWTIDGVNSGSAVGINSFTGIENLTGRGGDDIFGFKVGGSISNGIAGGGGDDTLIGADSDNEWNVNTSGGGTLVGATAFAGIENLIGGARADVFKFQAGGAVTGTVAGGFATPSIDALDFSAYGAAVTVDMAANSAGPIAEYEGIEAIVGSGSAADLLSGPGEIGDSIGWSIDGANTGEAQGLRFSQFANLRGRDGVSDAFFFTAGGSLSGQFDGGGVAGADGFAVVRGVGDYVSFVPTSDAPGTTLIAGRVFNYAGMEPFTPVGGTAANIVITGSVLADTVVVEDDGLTNGMTRVTFTGLNFWNGANETLASYLIANPVALPDGTASLMIVTGAGGDTITINSLDAAFAGDLLLYGSKSGTPNPEADAAHDRIVFAGSIATQGGYLEAFADDIVVASGKTLSTLKTAALTADLKPIFSADGEDNDIVFRARRIGTPEIENLLPSGYLAKGVSIDIGANANLFAGSIYLVAQAEDRDIATQAGVTSVFLKQGLIEPVMNFLTDLVSLPVKVLVKDAQAHVTIGQYAKLLAGDVIGIYANATTDASAQAKSQLVSIGYSQADATATINVMSYAVVEGGGAVNITSGAAATAQMATETSREEQGSVPGRSAQQSKGSAFSASLAVAYANVVSTTTVHQYATVHGGRTVNVRALGEVESAASAESGLFADGTAAIAVALQFSTANITTTLAGTVTADMNTEGGEVVKFEFDPTVKAAVYQSTDAPLTRLKTGDTVVLRTALSDATVRPGSIDAANWESLTMGAGTVLVYVGPDDFDSNDALANNQTFDLSAAANEINYRNRNLWEVTTAPWGFVDYANSRISVHNTDNVANNWVVVTEDTADYSPRRGASIGGLDAGKTYVVIQLEDDPTTATDESSTRPSNV